LNTFWLGAWEREANRSLQGAIDEQVDNVIALLHDLRLTIVENRHNAYHETLVLLGGFDEATRGAGITSAIAAAALAWLFRDSPIEDALLTSANTLSSDTDTIGTMAGAILGAAQPQELHWELQDRHYIVAEAQRLAAIAAGQASASFAYPDLAAWEPPSSQSDAVQVTDAGLGVCGLGAARPEGETWTIGEAEWQWLRLEFGQTVLAKRRKLMRRAKEGQFAPIRRGGSSDPSASSQQRVKASQGTLPLDDMTVSGPDERKDEALQSVGNGIQRRDLDELTDRVINGGFEPRMLGNSLLEVIDGERPLEQAVAFASIIAKAFVVRKRRRSSAPSSSQRQ